MNCPHCGSKNVEYLGVDDGGGAYGTSLCDSYKCLDCGEYFERNCVETEPEDYQFDDDGDAINSTLRDLPGDMFADYDSDIPF